MLRNFICLLVFFTSFEKVTAQSTQEFSTAIEDNSYLIEEAYNQEEGIVQHISNGIYNPNPTNDFFYSLTEEWPLAGYRHQFSYTIPYTFLNGGTTTGLGDILINYRYQVSYKEDWVCFSPRLSVILPTGNAKKGLGLNALGIQLNLPFSKRFSDQWVGHLNLGTTYYSNVKGIDSLGSTIKKNLSFANFGGSIIWLAKPGFNIMLEGLQNINSEIGLSGKAEYSTTTILNPGIRMAFDIGKLQIVPGLSIPISFSDSKTTTGLFFYLSFEHPFKIVD